MLQKIQLQTPDGVQDYIFIPDSVAYDQAKEDGLIVEGMDLVYRQFLVHVLSDLSMLVLTQIAPMAVPNPGAFDPGMPNVTFTVNGVPVSQEQFEQYQASMGGTHA